MTAMKTGSRDTDRVIVEVRCAESDAKALSALPRARAGAASAAPSMKQQP